MSRRYGARIAAMGFKRWEWRLIRLFAARLSQPGPLSIDGHEYHRRTRARRKRR